MTGGLRRTALVALLAHVAVLAATAAWAQDHDPEAVLSLATHADPTLNPWAPGAVNESNLINTILFDQLTRYGPDDLAPSPALATEWAADDDGMAWTFALREGVVWSDGEPFDAADVAFTFNDVVLNDALGAQSASQYASIDRVEVIDDVTVRFVLNAPFSALPYHLASFAGILPEHVLGEAENPLTEASFNERSPVTTGPFKVAEFVPGSHVRLEPNPLHWAGAPKIAGMVFRIVSDPNTQVAQALAGELDVVTRLSASLAEGAERSPSLEVLRQSQSLFYWIALNQDDDRFTDVRVRRALLMALDRGAMIDAVLEGYGQVATGPVAPLLGALYEGDVATYPYDPEAAGALLDEAGWTLNDDGVREKDGRSLSFGMPTGQFGYLVPASLLAQQYWEEIGVRADVEVMDWNAYIQEVVVERRYEATLAWWSMPPAADIAPYVSCEAATSGNNIPHYCSEELDALLRAGRRAITPEELVAVYAEIQRLAAEELPYLFLWYPDLLTAKRVTLMAFPEISVASAFQHAVGWYVAR
jgi:peptide/nickel transport system substrate-binding protein